MRHNARDGSTVRGDWKYRHIWGAPLRKLDDLRGLPVHEDFSRAEEVQGSSDRSFGLVFGGFFLLVGLAPLLRHPSEAVRWWALGLAVVFVALALFWQLPLKPLNWLWTRLGAALFHLVSPVMLGLVFCLAVVPVGLLIRLRGKDLLNLRFDRAASSYWVKREPPGPLPETMKNQF